MKITHGLFFFITFSSLANAAPTKNAPEKIPAQPPETIQKPYQPEIIDLPQPKAEEMCKPISFKNKAWISTANSNAYDYPITTKNDELTLLPDNRFGAGAAAIYPNEIKPPFEVKFEFSTYDDDGGKSSSRRWNSADGVSFFFLIDGKKYGTPSNGGKMGLSKNAKGYAVSFPTYGSRRVKLLWTGVRTLAQRFFSDSYSHGKWVPVTIQVTTEKITVVSRNQTILSITEDWTRGAAGNDFGFAAATGAADSEHKIRNFCFRKL